MGLPLDLEGSPHLPRPRTAPQVPPPPPTRWHNWTRTPSPLEDRTAFPSKPDRGLTPSSVPQPERDSAQLPGTSPSAADPWRPQDLRNAETAQGPSYAPGGALVLSKSAERLQEGRGDPKAKFRKSQSIDEIDAAPAVYSIPLADAQGGNLPLPQPIPRSQSAPMLDDDTLGEAQLQGGAHPQGGYQTAAGPTFLGSPEGVAQVGRTPSRGGQRGYLPGEPLLSPVGMGVAPQGPAPRSRPGLLRRADSLVSSAELAVFRRALEAQQPQLADRSGRLLYRNLPDQQQQQGAPNITPESHYPRRDARYIGQELKKLHPAAPTGYPTKSLPQRRPMSARSFSTEGYGGSQARPISARPSMAALLEKGSIDHTLSPCLERSGETELHLRSDVLSPHLRSDVLSPHLSSDALSSQLRPDALSAHLRSDALSSHLRSDALSAHLRSDALSSHLRSDALSSHLRPDALSVHLRPDALSSHLRPDALSVHLRPDALSSHLRPDALSVHLRPDALSSHLRPDALSVHLRPDALSSHLRPDALSSRMPADWRQQVLRHIEAKRLDRGSLLEREQDDLSPMSQWGPYALGRRDVPPESLIRKAGGLPHTQAVMMSSGAGAEHAI
ncbi:hypothetical protein SKAU_G00117090 [Synaphobranchus kaupii]|uniref:Uncharacterized protein n=1 Tax=Synaphobranchus kaupii TaxID=118154 RepID=A0A9Q1FMZ4_SYNKA|nr:hypothetical protein SKAU_G00117090 [Synaphobranchus kaupii]